MSLEIRNKVIQALTNKYNRNIAIAMHDSPDGDSIGSAVALEKTLLKLGKKVDIILQSRISSYYADIVGKDRINKLILPPEGKKYDLLLLLDCSDPLRTIDNIDSLAKKIITIDHHYGAKPFGNIYLYERTASTGMIIYKIIKKLTPIDNEIATALYLTIRSDTGNFKNNNTDSKAHEIAGELIFLGADIQLINEIYENKTLTFLKLMGYTFYDIHYDKQYKIVYLIIKIEQIKKANSNYEEAAMLIDYIRGIDGADIAFLFLESNESIRIKARSKYTNVAEILNHFNGGGHPNAAGAIYYSSDIYGVADQIIKFTKSYVDNLDAPK